MLNKKTQSLKTSARLRKQLTNGSLCVTKNGDHHTRGSPEQMCHGDGEQKNAGKIWTGCSNPFCSWLENGKDAQHFYMLSLHCTFGEICRVQLESVCRASKFRRQGCTFCSQFTGNFHVTVVAQAYEIIICWPKKLRDSRKCAKTSVLCAVTVDLAVGRGWTAETWNLQNSARPEFTFNLLCAQMTGAFASSFTLVTKSAQHNGSAGSTDIQPWPSQPNLAQQPLKSWRALLSQLCRRNFFTSAQNFVTGSNKVHKQTKKN